LLFEDNTGARGSKDIHLVLFMTAGMSLFEWNRLGMFEREVALYRRIREKVRAVTIVSYGDSRDLSLADRLPGISIVCNRWKLPPGTYKWAIRRLVPRLWRGRVVVKSNQMSGADLALAAARTVGAASIARCGFMLSEFSGRAGGESSAKAQSHRNLERNVFNTASLCVVTTPTMAATVMAYGVPKERVHIIPNYVETERLVPVLETRQPDRIGFVGRLGDQKNVIALAEAMKSVPAELLVIGEGPHQEALERVAQAGTARIKLLGRVPHADLPALLNTCSIFVLPSHYEGHPKALLEAMACGLPTVAADVPGIREVIRHGETGWLCGTDPASIAEALNKLLADAALRSRLGEAAREEVVRSCSLDHVVALECQAYAAAARASAP
jgi:glycosyltransferase involved in cell wall biosynthesis